MPGRAKRRRFAAESRMKFAASPVMPDLSRMAPMAASCSSALKTGLRTRRRRSALSFSIPSKRLRDSATASSCRSSRASSKRAEAYRPATPATRGPASEPFCATRRSLLSLPTRRSLWASFGRCARPFGPGQWFLERAGIEEGVTAPDRRGDRLAWLSGSAQGDAAGCATGRQKCDGSGDGRFSRPAGRSAGCWRSSSPWTSPRDAPGCPRCRGRRTAWRRGRDRPPCACGS